uniref:Putative secreted protein n=1 Tax=Anopheles darlingi TaxID=43151 RepID=A0A2M4DQR0_ANODA
MNSGVARSLPVCPLAPAALLLLLLRLLPAFGFTPTPGAADSTSFGFPRNRSIGSLEGAVTPRIIEG